jgi:hypothetical protein
MYKPAEVIKVLKMKKGMLYETAQQLKIAYKTLLGYLKQWPELQEAYEECTGRMLDLAESKLLEAVQKGQPWAICFFLKSRGKARGYQEKVILNAPFTEDTPRNYVPLEKLNLSFATRKELLQAFREYNGDNVSKNGHNLLGNGEIIDGKAE